MDDSLKRPQPKKIKMPPLVDRSELYDTLSFDSDTLPDTSHYKTFWKTYTVENDENHPENNSESVSELDSM